MLEKFYAVYSLDVRHLEGLDTLSITTLRSLADVCKYDHTEKEMFCLIKAEGDSIGYKIRVRNKGENSKLTKVNMNVQYQ